MSDEKTTFSRGDVLAKLAMAPLAIGALAAIQFEADAAAKSAKSAVQYVDKAPAAQKCSGCNFFLPGKGSKKGACKIVAGDISPGGYCVAFAAKS